MMDKRDAALLKNKWYESFDESKMIASLIIFNDEDEEEEIEVPCMYDVCSDLKIQKKLWIMLALC